MLVHSLIHSLGLLSPSYSTDRKLAPLTPKRALRDALSMYHTNDYLDFVLNPRRSAEAEEEGGSSNSADFGLEDVCTDRNSFSTNAYGRLIHATY